MKYYFIIFISLFTFCFACSSSKKTTETTEQDHSVTLTQKVETHFDKKCNCDKKTDYYSNGKIHNVSSYNDGHLLNSISYFPNGQEMMNYNYFNDAYDGTITSHYQSGKLSMENFYSNGYKKGTWKFYNEDGSLSEERIYADNKTEWDSQKDNMVKKVYVLSKLIYTETYIDGQPANIEITDNEAYQKIKQAEPPLGDKIFRQNCAICHSKTTIDIVGPGLKGITTKREKDWLLKMIINAPELIQSGDKDAVAVYEKYDHKSHPIFPDLKENEINALMDYLKTF